MSNKKTGKLTKVEKFYIENNLNKSVEEVAKDLNRTKASVEKFISEVSEDSHSHITEAKKNKDVSDLMGHKEDRGVTIMSPAASQLADENRSSRINKSTKHSDAIHNIKKK